MSTARAVLHSTMSVEWFTPAEYVDAARRVLGTIDLDPASCEEANTYINATKFYSKDQDGLKQVWAGKIFLNPPYGRTGQTDWTKKILAEYRAGNISEAILLVNSATGNKWFQPLFDYPICFTKRRIKFMSAGNVSKHSPTHSNVFVYLGPNEAKFIEEFGKFGSIVKQVS